MSLTRPKSAGARKTAYNALDAIEPNVRHLTGLVAALRILGEAGDSIEPTAISALARCASETLDEIERDWRSAIDILRRG
ncbi:hypothetical protein [Mesorhizobium sp. Root552]|jgi:hypothetical protein|uniref:hypothetical protein n=1 Tax=Mesorhizobium sp. Root552 TaxID=1736555 RepID=UPI000B13D4EF|nr:hypothetical protein [Mesorhizobium sp. Root552]